MKLPSKLLLLFVAMLLVCHGAYAQERRPENPVVVIELHGMVTDAQFAFLRRAIKDAERDKATAIILDMDTYGGVATSAIDMMEALLRSSIPTYTYVNTKAISAGALVALATQNIYMAPVSSIGAAAPVTGSGEDIAKTMDQKTKATISSLARSAAQQNGHNPDLADAFIDPEKELTIRGEVITTKDSLLAFSAQEAARSIGGYTLLAEAVVGSVEELMEHARIQGEIVRVTPSGFERAGQWITGMASVLIAIGVICIYLELQTPGVGIPGIVAGICFFTFFAGHYIAGLTGMEAVVVFFLGLVLVLVDLIFIPGVFILAIIGAVMMLGSLAWAMVDYYPADGLALPTMDMLLTPFINMALAVGIATVIILILARLLPETPLYSRLVLASSLPHGPGFNFATDPGVELAEHGPVVGDEGVALSMLRPSGKARFGDRTLDVITDGSYVPARSAVLIRKIEGSRIVVTPVNAAAGEEEQAGQRQRGY